MPLRQRIAPLVSVQVSVPWWDASTPVLRRFRHGALACKLTSGAILCRNGSTAIRVDGAGFAVAT